MNNFAITEPTCGSISEIQLKSCDGIASLSACWRVVAVTMSNGDQFTTGPGGWSGHAHTELLLQQHVDILNLYSMWRDKVQVWVTYLRCIPQRSPSLPHVTAPNDFLPQVK